VVEINGTPYTLCLLDTNAVSEIVKWPLREGRAFIERFAYGAGGGPTAIPCISPFTIIELRESPTVLDRFAEVFGVLPSAVLKGYTQLYKEEVELYATSLRPDPMLLAPSALRAARRVAQGRRPDRLQRPDCC
jgi:hypothetical protein